MYALMHLFTVVIVMLAHQNAAGIEVNLVSASSFSAKYAKLENKRMPIARNIHNMPSSL